MTIETNMLSLAGMENWFHMDRMTFERLLDEELGINLTTKLFSIDFDSPISFLIADTPHEIIGKIQQTLSKMICSKMICKDSCVKCSLHPSSYAKLVWFLQRLLIMSPFTKSLMKPHIDKICVGDENTMRQPHDKCFDEHNKFSPSATNTNNQRPTQVRTSS